MTPNGPEIGQAIAENHLIDGLPNWEAIDFDITCSRCGYNLRMLSKPKCTECGFEFDWCEMITRHFNINPDLFEHGWRRKPVRSYLAAVFKPTLRSARFWASVSLHDRIRPGPLFFLILTGMPAILLVVMGFTALTAFTIDQVFGFDDANRQIMGSGWYNPDPMTRAFADFSTGLWNFSQSASTNPVTFCSLILGAMLARMVVLWVFAGMNVTIARCRLRKAHTLRVVGYGSGAAYLAALLGGLAVVVMTSYSQSGFALSYADRWMAPLFAMAALSTILTIQFFVAFQRYLGIPQPLVSALALALLEVFCIAAAMVVFQTIVG